MTFVARRGTFVAVAMVLALALPASAAADVPLPGPLVALTAGDGTAYAVVATGARNDPFRLVRSGGRSVTGLGAFGSLGAEFADVAAGPVAVFARPTSTGFSYESPAGVALATGTGPPVLTPDGVVVYPDEDGDVVVGDTKLTQDGPVLRHAPLDATMGPLVLDQVQSAHRTTLHVIGPDAPTEPLTSVRGLHAIPATIARAEGSISVAYRTRTGLTIATAKLKGGHWSRRRVKTRGELNGAPAIARKGSQVLVATSQEVHGRRSIYVTTGTRTRRLTKPHGSDLAPFAATGSDGRVYVGWTRRTTGRSQRSGVLRRLL